MTDPFDDLERQLRGKVRGLASTAGDPADTRAPVPARRRRWRIGRGPLVVIAALGLTASGAAIAATTLHFSKSEREQGDSIANRAINASYRDDACKIPLHGDGRAPGLKSLRFVNATLAPAITDAIPWLAEPQSTAAALRAERVIARTPSYAGTIVRGTLRLLTTGPGQHLLVFVNTRGFGTVRDPVGCAQIWRARATQLAAGKPPAVLHWAFAVIDSNPMVNATTQNLQLLTDMPCPKHVHLYQGLCGFGGGGTGIVADSTSPRAKVQLGVAGFSTSNGARFSRYYGVAGPGSARILVHADHPSKLGPVPRYAVVHHRLWVLDLPMNTGPVHLTEVTRSGQVLRRMTVRNRLTGMRAAKRREARHHASTAVATTPAATTPH